MRPGKFARMQELIFVCTHDHNKLRILWHKALESNAAGGNNYVSGVTAIKVNAIKGLRPPCKNERHAPTAGWPASGCELARPPQIALSQLVRSLPSCVAARAQRQQDSQQQLRR